MVVPLKPPIQQIQTNLKYKLPWIRFGFFTTIPIKNKRLLAFLDCRGMSFLRYKHLGETRKVDVDFLKFHDLSVDIDVVVLYNTNVY